jgi:hypothetical protein
VPEEERDVIVWLPFVDAAEPISGFRPATPDRLVDAEPSPRCVGLCRCCRSSRPTIVFLCSRALCPMSLELLAPILSSRDRLLERIESLVCCCDPTEGFRGVGLIVLVCGV